MGITIDSTRCPIQQPSSVRCFGISTRWSATTFPSSLVDACHRHRLASETIIWTNLGRDFGEALGVAFIDNNCCHFVRQRRFDFGAQDPVAHGAGDPTSAGKIAQTTDCGFICHQLVTLPLWRVPAQPVRRAPWCPVFQAGLGSRRTAHNCARFLNEARALTSSRANRWRRFYLPWETLLPRRPRQSGDRPAAWSSPRLRVSAQVFTMVNRCNTRVTPARCSRLARSRTVRNCGHLSAK